jgi:hypothetical protein
VEILKDMLVHKKVIIDDIEYEYYDIKQLTYDLDTRLVGFVVIYYDEDTKASKIKTHYFQQQEEIDVWELIDKVKTLHDGKNI